jgi:hypothetical protein
MAIRARMAKASAGNAIQAHMARARRRAAKAETEAYRCHTGAHGHPSSDGQGVSIMAIRARMAKASAGNAIMAIRARMAKASAGNAIMAIRARMAKASASWPSELGWPRRQHHGHPSSDGQGVSIMAIRARMAKASAEACRCHTGGHPSSDGQGVSIMAIRARMAKKSEARRNAEVNRCPRSFASLYVMGMAR